MGGHEGKQGDAVWSLNDCRTDGTTEGREQNREEGLSVSQNGRIRRNAAKTRRY